MNSEMVERVALLLGDLRKRVVFLGGAATGLLLTDPGAPPIRATRDVDVIVQIGGWLEYRALEVRLLALGFRQDQSEGAPLCRWTQEGLFLDVMPTDPSILGFSNRWYEKALKESKVYTLPGGTEIQLVSAPCFLATKLEAFLGRGHGDFLGSHDLEDVVSLLDGREGLVGEIGASTPDLRDFISDTFHQCLKDDNFMASVQGNLPPDPASQARFPPLMERLRILSMGRSPG